MLGTYSYTRADLGARVNGSTSKCVGFYSNLELLMDNDCESEVRRLFERLLSIS